MAEIARHWPGAMRVAAPTQGDRPPAAPCTVERQRAAIYQAMLRWLIREPHLRSSSTGVDLKPDGSFKLLRAGLAVRGELLTLWEEVHPEKSAGSAVGSAPPSCARWRALPQGCRPVILSDAGSPSTMVHGSHRTRLGLRWTSARHGPCASPSEGCDQRRRLVAVQRAPRAGLAGTQP
ncbi:MAG: hypothetical protein IPH76_18900 [Xanthomonadales bacterium]|nr:hypothetical protein [Xanthomonadales bacterium]